MCHLRFKVSVLQMRFAIIMDILVLLIHMTIWVLDERGSSVGDVVHSFISSLFSVILAS